jgi:alkyldihydroxyacetonephosphate synthase
MTLKISAPAAPEIVQKLIDIVGENNVSVSPVKRLLNSRDMFPVSLMHHAEGVVKYFADVVVWPESAEHVAEVVKLAKSLRMPVIPFGAGSGVCGGVLPIHGGISLDLKKMNRILDVSAENMTVVAESGIMGQTFEEELNRRGYTLGHFPSSIYCSTLGGWAAARSAGQLSSKYGKIEDMVMGLEFVSPSGEITQISPVPGYDSGPDWKQVLIGSEGTLGVITKVTCRVHPYPESRHFVAFNFPDAPSGTQAMRLIMQHGLRPASMRLYDELDTMLVGSKGAEESAGVGLADFLPVTQIETRLRTIAPGFFNKAQRFVARWSEVANLLEKFSKDGCLLILMFEGQEAIAEYEYETAVRLCEKLGGKNCGPDPAFKWFKNRYHVSYKMSKVFYNGAFVDTIEVASTWKKLMPLYEEIRDAIRPRAFLMAHFSHSYDDGCSIYFTFLSSAKNSIEAEKAHRKIWRLAMEATLRVGGTVSHHHGIGLSKAEYMVEQHGDLMNIFRAVKDAGDPDNIMNPGKMGL